MGNCHPEKSNVDRGENFPCFPLVQSIFIKCQIHRKRVSFCWFIIFTIQTNLQNQTVSSIKLRYRKINMLLVLIFHWVESKKKILLHLMTVQPLFHKTFTVLSIGNYKWPVYLVHPWRYNICWPAKQNSKRLNLIWNNNKAQYVFAGLRKIIMMVNRWTVVSVYLYSLKM